jgi:hypothetical protein
MILTLTALLGSARAASAEREVHGGLDLRTDLRAHPVRVPVGLRVDAIDVTVVLDPLVLADGQHDGDITVEWTPCGSPVAWLAGWRTSSIDLAEGRQWQHRSLVGGTTALGELGPLRARFGAELSVFWVAHGAELPTAWLDLDRSITDRVRLGMFVRVEYATRR